MLVRGVYKLGIVHQNNIASRERKSYKYQIVFIDCVIIVYVSGIGIYIKIICPTCDMTSEHRHILCGKLTVTVNVTGKTAYSADLKPTKIRGLKADRTRFGIVPDNVILDAVNSEFFSYYSRFVIHRNSNISVACE